MGQRDGFEIERIRIEYRYSRESGSGFGDDEFIVLLERHDELRVKELFPILDKEIHDYNLCRSESPIRLALTKGYAVFDSENDTGYLEEFKRADNVRYQDIAAYYIKPETDAETEGKQSKIHGTMRQTE